MEENIVLAVIFSVLMALLVTGCTKGGMLAVPEMQPGDRVVIQFDRAERYLPMREREEEKEAK